MRKAHKEQAKNLMKLLGQAHDEVRELIEDKKRPEAMDLLGQCQAGAMKLGSFIEQKEGEGTPVVTLLEEYCEAVYEIYDSLARDQDVDGHKAYQKLQEVWMRAESSMENDIKVKFDIVFLPYKASMWDSMESVWQAAREDADCETYVIPIPYYDRKQNGELGTFHYEGGQLPSYVPVTHYEEYNLAQRQPDVIYIHNPYDYANYATSVDPLFYTIMLKKYTGLLVYIPYYSTTGGMSEAQVSCPAYYNADYIITQAEKYRSFFDSALPKEKLVPLGTPKFDRVIRICENPPRPPHKWKEKIKGKKVYFFNTSLNGMLSNTEQFLRKMKYVFDCFEGREDVCLLWRPHPLMESTFSTLRTEFKPQYDALKKEFIRKNIGIYDDTADITNTIALCDAYVGDSGTSVTSLFGIAGKPQFILDNLIDSVPGNEDWKGAIIRGLPVVSGVREGIPSIEKDAWMVTQGNKLYRREEGDDTFRHFCDLSDYASGGYYGGPVLINGKAYVFPVSARDIVVMGRDGIEKRIELKPLVEQSGAFYTAAVLGDYLFLIPNRYPFLVRYDTKRDEIRYFDMEPGLFTGMAEGERRCGAVGIKGMNLYLMSPVDSRAEVINGETGERQVMTIPTESPGGYMTAAYLPNDSDFWLLPYSGNVVVRWNPETGKVREYPVSLEEFQCHHIVHGYACMDRPFGNAVFYKNYVYLSPRWGNMYVRLNKESGEAIRWIPPIEEPKKPKNGYFTSWIRGYFGCLLEGGEIKEYQLFSMYDRKAYTVDFENDQCRELEIAFDMKDLYEHEPGFGEQSQWMQYACQENAFNSLPNFLDGNIVGSSFDRERQLEAYRQLAANSDGTSGEKIHRFVRGKL